MQHRWPGASRPCLRALWQPPKRRFRWTFLPLSVLTLSTPSLLPRGRCVAALNGRPPSFAVHFSADPAATAQALSTAAQLFAGSATCPPVIGAAADAWNPLQVGTSSRRAKRADTQHLVVSAVTLPEGMRCQTFSCDSPAVPDLADLRGALTSRPPAAILLSHPSFPVGQFASLLDDTFPYSAKAGAVASPVELPARDSPSSTVPAMVVRDALPPAAGPTCVGIAFSWTEVALQAGGDGQPRIVMEPHEFAVLARVVFGAARARGWYFSPVISSAMFLPDYGPRKQGEPPTVALDAARFPEGSTAVNVPLFVLDDIVVLPHGREDLVIYEPRYRLMLRSAIEAAGPSGVATFAIIGPRGMGTLVALAGRNSEVDGRAHVAVVGGRRLQVVPGSTQVALDAFGLCTGAVTFIDDVTPAESPEVQEAASEAVRRFVDVLAATRTAAAKAQRELTHAKAAQTRVEEAQKRDAQFLSWALASLLPADPTSLREWLACTNTAERLRSLAAVLQKQKGSIAAQWAATW